jgi:hypothetical protein
VKDRKPTARLYKILAKDESYQIGGLRLPSGDFTASDQEVADNFLETHFPGCQPIMENTARAIPVRTYRGGPAGGIKSCRLRQNQMGY